MDKEQMIAHCRAEADKLWDRHATMDVNDADYLRVEGMAQAYDAMVGYLNNGY